MNRHLQVVSTDPAPEPPVEGRRVARADVVAALKLLGLSPRYTSAIGFQDDGIWVHSVMPGKTGGVQVAQRLDRQHPNFVDHLPVDWADAEEQS